jgi:hypothetical protein
VQREARALLLGPDAPSGQPLPQYTAAHVRLGGLVGEKERVERLGSDPLSHVSCRQLPLLDRLTCC